MLNRNFTFMREHLCVRNGTYLGLGASRWACSMAAAYTRVEAEASHSSLWCIGEKETSPWQLKLAWPSQWGPDVLLNVNTFSEHQHWTKPFCNQDELRQKQDQPLNTEKNRTLLKKKKKKKKRTNMSLSWQIGVATTSFPIIAVASSVLFAF